MDVGRGGGLGLDAHGLQLAMSLRQNYFVWDNPKTSIYESFIVKWYQTARKGKRKGNNKSKQELIIEALD